jgi:hypothetical protein
VDLGFGEGDCQRQSGKAGAGADVGDGGGLTEGGGLEAGEAVGEVAVEGLGGVRDRRRRIWLGCESREESGKLVGGLGWKPVTGCEGLDRFS